MASHPRSLLPLTPCWVLRKQSSQKQRWEIRLSMYKQGRCNDRCHTSGIRFESLNREYTVFLLPSLQDRSQMALLSEGEGGSDHVWVYRCPLSIFSVSRLEKWQRRELLVRHWHPCSEWSGAVQNERNFAASVLRNAVASCESNGRMRPECTWRK